MTDAGHTQAHAAPSTRMVPRCVRALLAASLMLASTAGCARQGTDVTPGKAFDNPGNAQLADAVTGGDEALARELLAAGANPNSVDDQGQPLLQWVMKQGDRGAFRLLLALGADPALGNADGRTALHLAAMGKTQGWLEVLLEHGMSPDTPNTTTGATPLFDALRAGSEDNIALLLRAGARLDVADRNGTTPLHQAALVKDSGAVLRFLEGGADPRAADRTGATFQDYLFRGDPKLLNVATRRDLEKIDAWLEANGVAVTPRG
ncbi:ankyrin repeat domain-containing protein [Luteimonas sp. MJ204]|uniref:ankyrin repeat domain-containing protein n=1 Tax=Luteimonas sp. MJ145 TaxID=3129234 RepID=UPI0031BAFE6A